MASAAPLGRIFGLMEPGNIDLVHRPQVKLDDGSIATVRSMSFEEDGNEVLVPTVSPDGKILSDADAIALYRRTGQHLGKFNNAANADDYANRLHTAQARFYSQDPSDQPEAQPRPMNAWFYDADIPSNFTAAGGVAGLGEIVDAAQKQMQLVDNTNASVNALNQAYDQRIAAIRAATGQTIENPMRAAESDMEADVGRINPALATPQALDLSEGPPRPTPAQRHAQEFSLRLQDLQKQFPQFAGVIRADVPIATDAGAIAKAADENLARLQATRSAVPGLGANLVGGVIGSFNDPVQVMSMFAGAGPGVGRTVLARIANVALKEALVNGALTAAMQPTVLDWRQKTGVPHGFDEGVKNTLFAAFGGAVFGSGAEALGAVGRRVLTGDWLDRAGDEVAKAAPLRLDIRKALAGDADAAIAALKPIREAVAPEARAAIDLHESLSIGRDALPDTASPVVHQKNMDAAQKAAVDPAQVFEPQLDQAKVDRIVSDLVPDAPAPKKAESQSLHSFLIRAGGVQDQKGELSALGLTNVSEKFKGKLVRDSGMTLDHAREVAAEAGYLNHKYGTPTDAMEKSTVADLLDAMDSEARRTDAPEDDGGRSYVEQRVTDLMRQVGPEVDEKLIAEAVRRSEAEKIDLVRAFDEVSINRERERDWFANSGYQQNGIPILRLAEESWARETPGADDLSRATAAFADFEARTISLAPFVMEYDRRQLEGLLAHEEGHLRHGQFVEHLNANGLNDRRLLAEMEVASRALRPDAWTAGDKWADVRAYLQDPSELIADAFSLWTIDRPRARDLMPKTSAIFDEIFSDLKPPSAFLPTERADDPLMPAGDIAEPDAPDEAEMFTPADLEGLDPLMDIPFFDDGRAATARDIIDDIETIDWLRQITEACRT